MGQALQEIGSVVSLRHAWESVRSNAGVPGIDRVTVEKFGIKLEENLENLSSSWRPKAAEALDKVSIPRRVLL